MFSASQSIIVFLSVFDDPLVPIDSPFRLFMSMFIATKKKKKMDISSSSTLE